MDWKKKIKEIGIVKLVIMLAAGVLLLVISVGDLSFFKSSDTNKTTVVEKEEEKQKQDDVAVLEQRLVTALEKVEGVGKVTVMITLKSSKEKVTLKDSPYTDSTSGDSVEKKQEEETILIEEDGSTTPYVVKENEPIIEGVLVIAKGGGNQTLKNEIIHAVEVLFNVSSHKIRVMKMED